MEKFIRDAYMNWRKHGCLTHSFSQVRRNLIKKMQTQKEAGEHEFSLSSFLPKETLCLG